MPKYTNLPIVQAYNSFSASSTYHLVLEALEPEQLRLPECPHQPNCISAASCPYRQGALRKVATQLLLALSVLHEQMGYIHADMKPENILRCRTGTSHLMALMAVSPSMKVKLIDLGNAVPINRTSVYYDDFEVQSIHYRAPEVASFTDLIAGPTRFTIHLIHRHVLTRINTRRTLTSPS
jgi:serine/threonine protein kinase